MTGLVSAHLGTEVYNGERDDEYYERRAPRLSSTRFNDPRWKHFRPTHVSRLNATHVLYASPHSARPRLAFKKMTPREERRGYGTEARPADVGDDAAPDAAPASSPVKIVVTNEWVAVRRHPAPGLRRRPVDPRDLAHANVAVLADARRLVAEEEVAEFVVERRVLVAERAELRREEQRLVAAVAAVDGPDAQPAVAVEHGHDGRAGLGGGVPEQADGGGPAVRALEAHAQVSGLALRSHIA